MVKLHLTNVCVIFFTDIDVVIFKDVDLKTDGKVIIIYFLVGKYSVK